MTFPDTVETPPASPARPAGGREGDAAFRSEEQRRFHKRIVRHIETQDSPLLLEGGTGIGKTRAYLAALAGFGGRAAVVLPTRQLVDQVMASADMKATGLAATVYRRFDPGSETRADYRARRDAAMAGRVMLCTAASVIIDRWLGGGYNGATQRDYLLFDEADQLPAAAALQRDLAVTAFELRQAGVRSADAASMLADLLARPKLEPELRARALLLAEAADAPPVWYRKVGVDEEGGVILHHRLPGRLLHNVANRGAVAFISASLSIRGRFDDFKRSMGIRAESRFSGSIEPERHGSLTVRIDPEADIAGIVANAARPCLVATASHADSDKFARLLPGAVVREAGGDDAERETTHAAAERVPADGVLIAAGAWAGLDTPVRWASIVVPRIPFERPTVLDEKVESRYIDSRNTAIRRMRQVAGRGLRSPDARCDLYILDERYRTLGDFLPERFRDRLEESWREGALEERLAKERKRMRAYRPKVFAHYGLKCVACDFTPPNRAVMDVHHLDPLAEGERETTLDDLVPLCPTCHRWAHTENPPIPVDRLRTLRCAEAA
ncbi:MAG: hypothetical protein F4027_12915 [Rhodospirillaceae bacterium]|nr:hypothetical protein [Rhodospirillaceae bacterium]